MRRRALVTAAGLALAWTGAASAQLVHRANRVVEGLKCERTFVQREHDLRRLTLQG